MTLYRYAVHITDLEMVPLQAALDNYMALCRSEIQKGNTVPYRPHLALLEKFIHELHASSELLSESKRED